ncbi:MAG TPA: MASE1 domain-containing protein, partial [Rudaea sp.]
MLVAVLFALLSWAGIVATREAGRVATIWLANGLLIGILLRTSPRRWPAFVGAGLIGNILADLLAGDGIVGAIGLSACNAFEIGLAASWLRRVIGAQPDAFRIAATAWRIVPCVLLAPVVPSALGALTVAIVSGTSFWTALRLWYAADLLGLLLVAPFVLAIDHRLADRLWKSPRRAKNQLALLLLAVVTAVVFAQNELPLLFLVLPPLLLVVFRMGLPGAALGLLVLGVISLGFTVQGTGPLALVESATMPERVLLLQFYLVVASLMAYPVGVALTERHRLQRHLADSERRYRTLSENSSDIIVRTSFDRRRLYMSPSVTDILGWPVDELLGAPRTDLIHPDDLEAYMACDAAIRSGQRTATLVYRYRHREGHY